MFVILKSQKVCNCKSLILVVANASFSQKFTKAKRNWFANVHSNLNPEQGGKSLVGTTKTRHLHKKESGGHKERASLIEPVLMLSISMGRVNFAKGNWVFLTCLPWGYKQIHEFWTKAATFGSSSFALKVNCGGKSLGSPKGKTEMPFALTTLFHAPFEHGPLHGQGSREACWRYIWGNWRGRSRSSVL